MERDAEHLKLLSIFFYIKGAVAALFSCIFIIYIVMGGIFTMIPTPHNGNNAPPAAVGLLFVGVGSVLLLAGWTIAAVTIYAGRCLACREHRFFCMVVAGVNCIFIPYGTILGIFTFMVL